MSDRIFLILIWFSVLLVTAVFLWIIGDIVIKGFSHLSFAFLLENPLNSGRDGGIFAILIATILVLLIAIAVALPLGLSVAIWLSEYSVQQNKTITTTQILLDSLAGVPSIVYGLFGNAFFCVFLGLGFSILSGGLTLACMILPVFIRTCASGLRACNHNWRKGALALGMTRFAAIKYIILPAAAPAIIAALILGIGRATAETAALIFTSGYVDRMPQSLLDSGRSLAVHIYDLSMNITGGDHAAYASALVLIILIIMANMIANACIDKWLGSKVCML